MLRLLLPLLFLASAAVAQTPSERLRIGTREAPPFSMKTVDGQWTGISIDLLNELATRLDFSIELVETDLDGMISDVASGKLDASMAAMTITSAREDVIDFSHPYYHTGLGIAVRRMTYTSAKSVLRALTSRGFLTTVGAFLALLAVVGIVTWELERRHNPTMFERGPSRGIFSGFWWAAVTMTTVGYGDKVPVTIAGRLLAIVWMFAALLLTALFTAHLAAALTAASFSAQITSPADLARVRVGYVQDSASLEHMVELGARPRGYADVPSGLAAVAANEIDAFVHDRAILLWQAKIADGVAVTPLEFAPQYYGIVLPSQAPLRETINRTLLTVLNEPVWKQIQQRYLGGTR